MEDRERLEAFERMLADVQNNYAQLTARMGQLKAQNREKTATFRQYWSEKMTCQYILSLYRDYGLLDGTGET